MRAKPFIAPPRSIFRPKWPMAIQQRLERSGVAFVAELPQRHAAATLRLKELIATRLGSPRLVFCHQRIPAEAPGTRPQNKPPVLPMHEMVQLVDWCRYVVGRQPTSVLGLSHSGPGGQEIDYEMMSLDFAAPGGEPGSGVTCQISSGRYMPIMWHEAVSYRPPAALQVACENGIAFIDMPSSLVWFDKAGRHMESLDSERPVGEQLLNQFHRAVTSLVRNTSGLEDAFQAMAIVQQARESHHNGRRMALDAVPALDSDSQDPGPATADQPDAAGEASSCPAEAAPAKPPEPRRKKK